MSGIMSAPVFSNKVVLKKSHLIPVSGVYRLNLKRKRMFHSCFGWMLFTITAVFLSLGITLDKLASISFYLLLLLSIIAIAINKGDAPHSYFNTLRLYWPLYLAMSGFLICAAINQIILRQDSSKDYNFGFHFFGFVFLFWLFQHLSTR